MPLVSEALCNFLQARKTPANADLVGRCSINMEIQVNVLAADGEPVAGKKSTWTNGSDTWHSIRIPKTPARTRRGKTTRSATPSICTPKESA